MADNRRTSTRHLVSIAATLLIEDVLYECLLLNLSLGGALISAIPPVTIDRKVRLAFHVPALAEAIETDAVVRWIDHEGVGLQFGGLRAREVWALNELFRRSGMQTKLATDGLAEVPA